MTEKASPTEQLIWATRGRSWGFRFLLDAGLGDPLSKYEHAFFGMKDTPTAWRREGDLVALRILDPLARKDTAGRTIPHEFVVLGALAGPIDSVESGLRLVWPLVADAYAGIWEAPDPPTRHDLRLGPV